MIYQLKLKVMVMLTREVEKGIVRFLSLCIEHTVRLCCCAVCGFRFCS